MTWQLDPFHTQVELAVKHLGMMTVRGHFSEVTASGTIDPENPAASSVDLTIKGNTRPVTLQVLRYGEFNDPTMMGHRIAYSAEGQIDRKDFGLTMNMMLDGRWVVGDEVKIMIEVELVERKQEARA